MEVIDHNPYGVDRPETYYTDAGKEEVDDSLSKIRTDFTNFILQDGYPCVGAQAAVNGGTFALGDLGRMDGGDTPKNLAYGLMEYLMAISNNPSYFLSYIAVFPDSDFADELAFETSLWQLLDRLHKEDRKHFDWNPVYSKDPADSDFSFSFGGRGFFIVGLHPKSSRKARRFNYPALAFNLQDQFEGLREKGRFDVIREAIRQRELEFQGSINPMLADYGEGLQAPQYSGRKVGGNWKCPFSG